LGGEAPTPRIKLSYLKVLLSWSWIELFLSFHLQAIRGKRAYMVLFEKMEEDVGFVQRNCEGIWGVLNKVI
jgi:hypothetical protein